MTTTVKLTKPVQMLIDGATIPEIAKACKMGQSKVVDLLSAANADPTMRAAIEEAQAKRKVTNHDVATIPVAELPEAPSVEELEAAGVEKMPGSITAAARRALLNQQDRVTVRARNAEDRAKRRAEIDAFHAKVCELYRKGLTTKAIAEGETNARTGAKYTASTIHWILVKHGVIEKGAGRAKFDLSSLTPAQIDKAESAYAAMRVIAEENGVTFAKLAKAIDEATNKA